MKKCIIVVPTHTFELNDDQVMSLKQLLSFYHNKYIDIDIAIVYPNNLDISELKKYNISLDNIIKLKKDSYWFSSGLKYCELCLDNEFYSPWVNKYEYMLIYQLDCFIFKDELHYWCDKGYDYIGGFDCLWLHKYNLNGGFSLRKLSVFNELIKQNINIYDYNKEMQFEDQIFTSLIYPENKSNIQIDDFVKFSINIYNYAHIAFFTLLKDELPFGCHSFQNSLEILNLCKNNINYQE